MKLTIKFQCNSDCSFFIMGSNEKKNFFVIYSKFIILFKFIQEEDYYITIISRRRLQYELIKKEFAKLILKLEFILILYPKP